MRSVVFNEFASRPNLWGGQSLIGKSSVQLQSPWVVVRFLTIAHQMRSGTKSVRFGRRAKDSPIHDLKTVVCNGPAPPKKILELRCCTLSLSLLETKPHSVVFRIAQLKKQSMKNFLFF